MSYTNRVTTDGQPTREVDAGAASSSAPACSASDPHIYPCDNCGRLRNIAEGGNIFTLCDECWDDKKPNAALTGQQKPEKGMT